MNVLVQVRRGACAEKTSLAYRRKASSSCLGPSRLPSLLFSCERLAGFQSQVLVPFGKGRVHFLKEARNPILLGLFDGLFGLSQFQPLRPDVRLLSYVGG